MMDMSIDVKCSITVAILSVLVYLLLINIFQRVWDVEGKPTTVGVEMNSTEWYKSMEVMMLVAVFLAYNINFYLFSSCKSSSS